MYNHGPSFDTRRISYVPALYASLSKVETSSSHSWHPGHFRSAGYMASRWTHAPLLVRKFNLQPLDLTVDLIHLFRDNCLRKLNSVPPRFSDIGCSPSDLAILSSFFPEYLLLKTSGENRALDEDRRDEGPPRRVWQTTISKALLTDTSYMHSMVYYNFPTIHLIAATSNSPLRSMYNCFTPLYNY